MQRQHQHLLRILELYFVKLDYQPTEVLAHMPNWHDGCLLGSQAADAAAATYRCELSSHVDDFEDEVPLSAAPPTPYSLSGLLRVGPIREAKIGFGLFRV